MILWELFYTFFTIGAFTFGGGYAMIALIQSEVASKGWLTQQQLVDFVAIAESTPGPIAVNMATFVGSRVGGFWGALLATLGVVLPSFVIILVVAKCFRRFRSSTLVKGAMSGLKPAVIGMIGSAILSMSMTVFFPAGLTAAVFTQPAFYAAAGIFAGALILSFRKLHPIGVILLTAAAGVALGYLGII